MELTESTETTKTTQKDVIVIGAGVSGLVGAKCLQEDGFSVAVLERTGEVGGLWMFRENDYGVMRFTHINVSKHNYCFSDFPFPDDVCDFPHNTDMANYIVDYTKHFKLNDLIHFHIKVLHVERKNEEWHVTVCRTEDDGKTETKDREIFVGKFLAIASGHHAAPNRIQLKGEETFTGDIIHSVDYNDAITNGYVGKRVLVVGIGNSAVDVAVDCATVGRCKSVYISTRSGAWIVPNYVFGHAVDLYACRAFFMLPWRWANVIFETIIKLISGNPRSWGLNPKMRALQTQPTVSPTLIHHIQRENITLVPNILKVDGDTVYFVNGSSAKFDSIICCTGYKINLPYLSSELREQVMDENKNSIKLYKNVFSPHVGHTLGFIGFVQPASGGILTMSEIQARWFSQLCKGKVRLPSNMDMEQDICRERRLQSERWYESPRHTIQRDPIKYNDEIASFIGSKPNIFKHPSLAWRLIFGSCGAYQWRLQGPNKWSGAEEAVRGVPLTELMTVSGIAVAAILLLVAFFSFCVFYRMLDVLF
ncbi:flavin-containing monooxygenase 5-like [Gigantopelta aegis]|uniref:flavin-containing monooxygenase 5-like n=1 Tax=Gigantopelta aegis TaxID=1735272 RepID=UPI001B88D738|nr:flavin-containing monooxygenase 5-like [Gigantopelta aegis]XP_041354143.1 flavin-containing monooxygenase 5-like [Gigantopelta aegis]